MPKGIHTKRRAVSPHKGPLAPYVPRQTGSRAYNMQIIGFPLDPPNQNLRGWVPAVSISYKLIR